MSYSPEKLKELFQQAKEGHPQAFSNLFDEFYKPIFSYIFIRIREREIAKDLTQDVFLKVYGSIDRVYVPQSSPLAYFYTVAKNTLIDYFRKKKSVTAPDELFLEIADESVSTEEHMDQLMELNRVMEVIKTLPEDQEQALLLRYIDDKSYPDIARALNKTEDAVRQLVSRALKTLRNTLDI